MTSLIRIIQTMNGRKLINLSKVSVIEVKDNYRGVPNLSPLGLNFGI
jgi:hypothetical protein